MASAFYPNIFKLAFEGDADLEAGTVKVALVGSSYTYDPDHDFMSDISDELVVADYARQTIANVAVTLDTTNNRCKIDGDDVTFTGMDAGDTFIAAIVYLHVGADDAANPLIGYVDKADTATDGNNITISWNSVGFSYVS